MSVSDGMTRKNAVSQCDDGSDDSLVPPRVVEAAVINGIGKLTAIEPVRIEAYLRNEDKAHSFIFSRSWLV